MLAGVSLLPGGGGVCVEVLALDAAPVAAALRATWGVARLQLRDAPSQRRWKY